MKIDRIRELIKTKGLKVTPQRVAVLDVLLLLENHPTAELITQNVQKKHPNIARGTVYKTLETFVENQIVRKVKTDKDIMRYDAILDKHHHLYCAESDRIEDYYDDDLNELLENYFKTKKIKNFKIEDIKLQILGNFKNN